MAPPVGMYEWISIDGFLRLLYTFTTENGGPFLQCTRKSSSTSIERNPQDECDIGEYPYGFKRSSAHCQHP